MQNGPKQKLISGIVFSAPSVYDRARRTWDINLLDDNLLCRRFADSTGFKSAMESNAPKSVERKVMAWAEKRQAELLLNWERLQQHQAPESIDP